MTRGIPPDEPPRLEGPVDLAEFRALMVAAATLDAALREAIYAEPVEVTTTCFGEPDWEFKLMIDGTDAQPAAETVGLMRSIAIVARPVGREHEDDGAGGYATYTTPFVTAIGSRASATVRAGAKARAAVARDEAAALLRSFADAHGAHLHPLIDRALGRSAP